MKRLREKLRRAGSYIETVRGVGYRMRAPEQTENEFQPTRTAIPRIHRTDSRVGSVSAVYLESELRGWLETRMEKDLAAHAFTSVAAVDLARIRVLSTSSIGWRTSWDGINESEFH